MKTSHTQGPWTIREPGLNEPQTYLSLLGAEKETGWCTHIGQIRMDLPADASLVATAPELLDVLEDLLFEIEVHGVHPSAITSRAIMIIKKARGEA